MSTILTQRGIPMVESQSLQLVFAAAALNGQISDYLSTALKQQGYLSVTSAILNFLSALECGINYGSEIARRMDISRQMVSKTVKELCRVGYLEQIAAVGKQKQILFTEAGERLMSASRRLLAGLDEIFYETMGRDSIKGIIAKLQTIQSIIPSADITCGKPSEATISS